MPDKTTPHIRRAAAAMFDALMAEPDGNVKADEFGYQAADNGGTILDGAYDLERVATATLSTTLEPSEAEIEAAMDEFSRLVSGGGTWAMRGALVAAARVRVGE